VFASLAVGLVMQCFSGFEVENHSQFRAHDREALAASNGGGEVIHRPSVSLFDLIGDRRARLRKVLESCMGDLQSVLLGSRKQSSRARG